MEPTRDDEIRGVLTLIGAGGALGLIFSIARGVVFARHGGWRGFIRTLVAGAAVGAMAALALDSMPLSRPTQGAIVAILAVCAEDMLAGLILLGQLFRSDPLSFVRHLFRSLRGGEPPKPPAQPDEANEP